MVIGLITIQFNICRRSSVGSSVAMVRRRSAVQTRSSALFNAQRISVIIIAGIFYMEISILSMVCKGDVLEVSRFSRHSSFEMLIVYDDFIKMKRDLPRYYKTFKNIKF